MSANWPSFALIQDQVLVDQKPPALLKKFQTGSATERKDAFSAIYNCYALPMWKYIYNDLSGSESDAKDIFCQVWLTTLENLDDFQWRLDAISNDPLRAWLFECAYRRIKAYRRKKKLTVPMALVESYAVYHLDGDDNADLMALFVPTVKQAADQMVYAMLEKLKENHRTILKLRYYNNMSFAEIGHVIGKSEGAVRKQHHYIVHKLRNFFEERSNAEKS